jgi:hypothetical protein
MNKQNTLATLQPLMTAPGCKRYEAWNDESTPFRSVMRLDAATYRTPTLFDLPSAPWPEGGQYVVSPRGNFAYQNRIVPEGHSIRLYGKQRGRVVWNGDVAIPTLIDLNRQCHSGERFSAETPVAEKVQAGAVWMSLTPMEMMTQRSAVKMASHVVVIGGLGLGWLLRKVCEKADIERVVVVEKSQELLDWYGYRMCGGFEKVVEVICDDVYRQIGKHGPTARYLLDIWHLYSGAQNDYRLDPFRRTLKRRLWAWGLDD